MDDGMLLRRFCGPQTHDVDEFRTQISNRLTRHSLYPLVPAARVEARFGEVSLGPLSLVYADHRGAELAAEFTDKVCYYDVNLSYGGRNRVAYDGGEAVVDAQHAVILSPTMAARMRLSSEYRQLHVRIERPTLERHLERLLAQPVRGPILFRPDMHLVGAAASWSEAIAALARDLDRPNGIANQPLAVASWTEFLMTSLLSSQPHNYSARLAGETAPYRRRDVTRAIDYIDQHLDHPLTLSRIAAAAGVSARSLQRDFQECLEISPMAYVQQRRLDCVHAELQSALPGSGVTVTDTALRWGFTHGPRFAAAYRRRYGVAPSETLRRAAGGGV